MMSMQTKEEKYELLCRQMESLIADESDVVGVEANVSALLMSAFPERFWWVGFYMVRDGNALRLGPFQGPVACYSIPKGRGVCGTAWEKAETILVPDVEQFPGHIACSAESRSEIVVPLFRYDRTEGVQPEESLGLWTADDVVGVLDIDSRDLDAFDAVDQKYLERISKMLSKELEL